MTGLPRGGLPPIQFVETDASVIENDIISTYELITNRKLAPADPVRLFLLSLASIIVQLNMSNDNALKQTYLSYAMGSFIDHIGFLMGVTRQPASKALTTLKFTLSSARPSVTSIPVGTQVAAGQVIFETAEALEIPAGSMTGEVTAAAKDAGEAGNGFAPGSIKTIVNPIPFVQSADNVTTSAGGAPQELDEPYVERIRTATATFSVAGPIDAYLYWTFSANPGIKDASIYSPTPGVVDVHPLMSGGELPSPEVISQVLAKLSDKTIRPLTDYVRVLEPVAVNLDVDVKYWIRASDLPLVDRVKTAIEKAVDNYIAWQVGAIGRDIIPDELVCRMISAGAKRVEITSPTYAVVSPIEVAQLTSLSVTYGGAEDE